MMAKWGYLYTYGVRIGYTISAFLPERKLILRKVSYRDKTRIVKELKRDGAYDIKIRRLRLRVAIKRTV